MCPRDTLSGTCSTLPCSAGPVLRVLPWTPLTCDVMDFGNYLLFKSYSGCSVGDGLMAKKIDVQCPFQNM